MNRWQDVFEVTEVKKNHKVFWKRYEWHIIDKSTGKTIGTYEDGKYAIKQARYKFKKMLNKIDRILLKQK